jgi:hypothetical protein
LVLSLDPICQNAKLYDIISKYGCPNAKAYTPMSILIIVVEMFVSVLRGVGDGTA